MIDYSDILKAFHKEAIEFTVIGGFAAIAHGVVRVTMDLDLAVALEESSLEKTWELLLGLGFYPRQPLQKSQFSSPDTLLSLSREKGMKAVSFIHEKQSYLIVDLLFEEEFQLKNDETVTLNLFGVNCKVASIEKLIELKSRAGRAKDLEDIRELKRKQK